MRKYLTTGLFSAILGIVIGGAPADAALVSRGFLDEALENYATTTALDLKADNADLTNLSNKIGELPDSAPANMWYTVTSFREPVPVPPGAELPETLGGQLDFWLSGQESVMEHFARMLVMDGGSLEDDTSTPDDDFLGLWPLTQKVKNIEENITLPEGITVQGMYEGWTDENGVLANPGLKGIYVGWVDRNGLNTLGLQGLELDSFYIYNLENDSPQLLKGQKGGLLSVLSSLLDESGYSEFDGVLAPFWKLTQSARKTDELSAKIGTLPTEYETVGAALTAIKGIAEEAKAAALSAIPDPKAEGSTGKFVLTVDIVGDNATYRWEKIDREGETTTTTE